MILLSCFGNILQWVVILPFPVISWFNVLECLLPLYKREDLSETLCKVAQSQQPADSAVMPLTWSWVVSVWLRQRRRSVPAPFRVNADFLCGSCRFMFSGSFWAPLYRISLFVFKVFREILGIVLGSVGISLISCPVFLVNENVAE